MFFAPLLALVLVAKSTDLNDLRLDMTLRATPAPKVLKVIAEKAGLRVNVRGTVDKDVIVVRFKDVPAKEALDKLAETLEAKWSVADGELLFYRSKDVDARQAREMAEPFHKVALARAESSGALKDLPRDALEKLWPDLQQVAEHPAGGVWNEADGKVLSKAHAFSPSSRMMGAILTEIDPSVWLDADAGSAITLSTNPKGSELKLSPKATRYFERARREAMDLLATSEKLGLAQLPDSSVVRAYALSSMTKPLAEASGLKIRIVRTWELRVEYAIFGPDGQAVCGAEWPAPSPDISKVPSVEDIKGLSGDFVPSERSRDWLKLVKYWEVPEEIVEASDFAKKMVLGEALEDDILAGGASDAVLAVSGFKGKNLVALLPDRLYDVELQQRWKDKMPLRSAAWSVLYPCQLTDTDRWLSYAPRFPYLARRDRIPRKALGVLAAGFLKNRGFTLEDFSGFALQCETDQQYRDGGRLVAAMFKRYGHDVQDREILALYATLSRTQQLQARNGGFDIPLNKLSRAQAYLLSSLSNTKRIYPYSVGDKVDDEMADVSAIKILVTTTPEVLGMNRQLAPPSFGSNSSTYTAACIIYGNTTGEGTGAGTGVTQFQAITKDLLGIYLVKRSPDDPSMSQYPAYVTSIEHYDLLGQWIKWTEWNKLPKELAEKVGKHLDYLKQNPPAR